MKVIEDDIRWMRCGVDFATHGKLPLRSILKSWSFSGSTKRRATRIKQNRLDYIFQTKAIKHDCGVEGNSIISSMLFKVQTAVFYSVST